MAEISATISQWDRTVFLGLNHGLKCGFLDWLMPRITNLGLGYVQAGILVVLAFVIMPRRCGFAGGTALFGGAWLAPLLLAILFSGVAATLIKTYTERDRPWWFYEKEHADGRGLDVIVETVPGPDKVFVYGYGYRWIVYPLKVRGFPSGHTTTTAAIAMTLTLLWRRRMAGVGWVAGFTWVFAFAIGLSRIYIASHWPMDVVGGVVIGILGAIAAVKVCNILSKSHDPADDACGAHGITDAGGARV